MDRSCSSNLHNSIQNIQYSDSSDKYVEWNNRKTLKKSLIDFRILDYWMISSLKHKILLNSFIFVSFLLFNSMSQNQVEAQYGSQNNLGAAELEEQLEKAREKLERAQSQGAYGSGTAIFGSGNPINAISDFFNNFLNMIGLSTPGFTKYTDPSGAISFQYPSDWVKISEINLNNFGVSLASPTENEKRAVFTLSREDSDYLFLDTYKDSKVSELQNTNLFGYGFSGIEGPIDTTLAGLPAFQIKFISPALGGLDTIEVNTIKDDKQYSASFQGKPDVYQKHLDSFNKILSTVKIK